MTMPVRPAGNAPGGTNPRRRALVEEGTQALLALGRDAQAGDQLGVFDIEAFGGGRVGTADAQRQLLGFALSLRAGLGEEVQLALDRLVQRVARHHRVQQADAVSSAASNTSPLTNNRRASRSPMAAITYSSHRRHQAQLTSDSANLVPSTPMAMSQQATRPTPPP
ncbi:hypothetical protein RLIN73S_06572 [Rhodanobacter lindaniclasticus]